MRLGCRNLVITLVWWVISATLLAAGAALLLYGLFAYGGPLDVRAVAALVIVPLGTYLLLRVGGGVWRDMRQDFAPRRPEPGGTDGEEEEEPSPPDGPSR